MLVSIAISLSYGSGVIMREQRINEQDGASKTISICLPVRDAEALRERARREDRSVSSIVRIALRRAAERETAEVERVEAR